MKAKSFIFALDKDGMRTIDYAHPKYTFGWKAAVVMFLGMLIVSSILAVYNVFSMYVLHTNLQYSDFFMILLNTAGLLGAILAFDFLICRPQTGRPLSFNFGTANLKTYLLIFPMMLGMMLIAEFFTAQIPVTGPIFGELYKMFSKLMDQISQDIPTMLLMTVFFAPILEEIIFRGIIMKGLINKGWQPWKAILLSAVVFGLVHGNPWQFMGAILLGSVLGLVYYRSKSLLLPILLHAFNNLCSCLLIIYYKNESFADTFHVPVWVVLAIGIILFGVFYYLFTRRHRVIFSESV